MRRLWAGRHAQIEGFSTAPWPGMAKAIATAQSVRRISPRDPKILRSLANKHATSGELDRGLARLVAICGND